MNLSKSRFIGAAAAIGAFAMIAAGGTPAHAAKMPCGLGTGVKATGEPILVGGIVGKTGPDDFSSSADAAAAYFKCVNDNGGINGRPIRYIVEDDKWNPEVAAQAASKLVKDLKVVALVANGSFVSMTVNAKLYEKEGVAVVAAACAVRECFEAKNIASTNQGPLPSNLGAVQWAVKNLGTKSVVCISVNIPSVGAWSCDAVAAWLKRKGLKSTTILIDPGSADLNSALLRAVAANHDTILVNLPAGIAIGVLKAAREQDLRDRYKWIAPTPLYDKDVPKALGAYWSGKVHVQIELTPHEGKGKDAKRWRAIMDKYARPEDPRDTFSQAGFLAANIFVDTLLKMKPNAINRASVTKALRAVKNYRSDLMCGPWYFGPGNRHIPNHAGMMVTVMKDGFKVVAGCFNVESKYLDPIYEREAKLGLVGKK